MQRVQPAPADWAVGMVLVRESRDLQIESYTQELIAGLDESVSGAGGTFLVKIVPDEASERTTYKEWAASEHIQWVVVENFTVTDTRRTLLEGLGLEVMVLGDVEVAGDRPVIWNDHAEAMRIAMRALHGLGHRVIAHVSGPTYYRHTLARTAAFLEIGAELGISVKEQLGDYSRQSGVKATRMVLEASPTTTAILFDNDLMALGGLDALTAAGKSVPDELSIAAWDDSVRAQMAIPPLAVLNYDVRELGRLAGQAVIRAREGVVTRGPTPLPTFIGRGSVAAPPPRGTD